MLHGFEDIKQERHTAGLLYVVSRTAAGLTQRQAADILDVQRPAWSKFESTKKRYHLRELVELRRLSGLTWDQWGAILDEAAKPKE